MTLDINRRLFVRGLICAPAIISASSLMPLRGSLLEPLWGRAPLMGVPPIIEDWNLLIAARVHLWGELYNGAFHYINQPGAQP